MANIYYYWPYYGPNYDHIDMVKLAHKISAFNRRRKWSLFLENISFDNTSKVLDVGYAPHEYSSVDNYLEKVYPYQNKLIALGYAYENHNDKEFKEKYPQVKIVKYAGEKFPFKDNAFDICWSNAVIEHVEEQLLFLKELHRVSKKVFFTTPNKFFPVEVHTRTPLLHFLPKKIFDKYLNLIGKNWASGSYMHLLSLRQIKKLLKDANIDKYQIIKNKLFGFTLDFVIII